MKYLKVSNVLSNSIVEALGCTFIFVLVVAKNGLPRMIRVEFVEESCSMSKM